MNKHSDAEVAEAIEIIARSYTQLAPNGGYVRVINIIDSTDIRSEVFGQAVREMYRGTWDIIQDSIGGNVSDRENKYCPTIGNHPVHLISR